LTHLSHFLKAQGGIQQKRKTNEKRKKKARSPT